MASTNSSFLNPAVEHYQRLLFKNVESKPKLSGKVAYPSPNFITTSGKYIRDIWRRGVALRCLTARQLSGCNSRAMVRIRMTAKAEIRGGVYKRHPDVAVIKTGIIVEVRAARCLRLIRRRFFPVISAARKCLLEDRRQRGSSARARPRS